MQYGARVSGILKPLFVDSLSMSKPNEIYELHIETDGVSDEAMAIQQALMLEEQFPDLKVLYVETTPNRITMQITDIGPSPWSFSGVFSAIPAIFVIVGIIIVGVILLQVYQTNPLILWGLVLIGGVVTFYLLLGERLAFLKPEHIRTEGKESDKELKETIRIQAGTLSQERATIKTNLTDIRDAQDKARADAKRLEETFKTLKKIKKPRPDQKEQLKTIPDQIRGLAKKDKGYQEIQETYQKRLEDIAKQQEVLGRLA